ESHQALPQTEPVPPAETTPPAEPASRTEARSDAEVAATNESDARHPASDDQLVPEFEQAADVFVTRDWFDSAEEARDHFQLHYGNMFRPFADVDVTNVADRRAKALAMADALTQRRPMWEWVDTDHVRQWAGNVDAKFANLSS